MFGLGHPGANFEVASKSNNITVFSVAKKRLCCADEENHARGRGESRRWKPRGVMKQQSP